LRVGTGTGAGTGAGTGTVDKKFGTRNRNRNLGKMARFRNTGLTDIAVIQDTMEEKHHIIIIEITTAIIEITVILAIMDTKASII
jgi:hypothetical protein